MRIVYMVCGMDSYPMPVVLKSFYSEERAKVLEEALNAWEEKKPPIKPYYPDNMAPYRAMVEEWKKQTPINYEDLDRLEDFYVEQIQVTEDDEE